MLKQKWGLTKVRVGLGLGLAKWGLTKFSSSENFKSQYLCGLNLKLHTLNGICRKKDYNILSMSV